MTKMNSKSREKMVPKTGWNSVEPYWMRTLFLWWLQAHTLIQNFTARQCSRNKETRFEFHLVWRRYEDRFGCVTFIYYTRAILWILTILNSNNLANNLTHMNHITEYASCDVDRLNYVISTAYYVCVCTHLILYKNLHRQSC